MLIALALSHGCASDECGRATSVYELGPDETDSVLVVRVCGADGADNVELDVLVELDGPVSDSVAFTFEGLTLELEGTDAWRGTGSIRPAGECESGTNLVLRRLSAVPSALLRGSITATASARRGDTCSVEIEGT